MCLLLAGCAGTSGPEPAPRPTTFADSFSTPTVEKWGPVTTTNAMEDGWGDLNATDLAYNCADFTADPDDLVTYVMEDGLSFGVEYHEGAVRTYLIELCEGVADQRGPGTCAAMTEIVDRSAGVDGLVSTLVKRGGTLAPDGSLVGFDELSRLCGTHFWGPIDAARRAILDGTYAVGKDIPAGRYVTLRGFDDCSWARTSAHGDLIENDLTGSAPDKAGLTLLDGEGFEFSGCGMWFAPEWVR